MKTCTICGKENVDDAFQCLCEAAPLLGIPSTANSPLPASPALNPITSTTRPWTERQFLIAELLVVCLVAFSASTLHSIESVFAVNAKNTITRPYDWQYTILHQASALALVWFVLKRRAKTFSDLGLSWTWFAVLWSLILYVAGRFLYIAVYYILYAGAHAFGFSFDTTDHVGQHFMSGGVSSMFITDMFLNPFFEELIVRAYLMTVVKEITGSVIMAIFVSALMQTGYHLYQGIPLALSLGQRFFSFPLFTPRLIALPLVF